MSYLHDVFFSFAGAEIRTNFVEQLYAVFDRNGIRTFVSGDDEEPEAALKAIEESRCAIVIFSRSYASSSKSLDELVKIMELSREAKGLIVLPVFYHDMSPSEVHTQGAVFGGLFSNYEFHRVKAWAAALTEAANLAGFNLYDHRLGATSIKPVSEMVTRLLGFSKQDFPRSPTDMEHEKSGVIPSSLNEKNLTGMERRVQEVEALLESETGKSEVVSSFPPYSSYKYEVFLSFRGTDTRKQFTDHLYRALSQKRFHVFSDDILFTRNESISAQLLKAIEESRIAVVTFSKNYAASSHCLDELVKIMNCHEQNGQIVLPVFYDVDASDVRNQQGYFGESFMQHKTKKVEVWRKALVQAGSLSGWNLNYTKRDDSRCVEEIVKIVTHLLGSSKLNFHQSLTEMEHKYPGIEPSSIDEETVIGIKRRVQEVKALLESETGVTGKSAVVSSFSPSSSYAYDVFLSFRGKDSRTGFAATLNWALCRTGVRTFMDDGSLRNGEPIASRYFKTIEESCMSVVIFSKNYAASSWCLDELVKIMNCHERNQQLVFPVFYDVDPSDVRMQKGYFGEAFMQHKTKKLEVWRKALVQAASFPGCDLNCRKSHEATVIKAIVDEIKRRLVQLPLCGDENLIGIKPRMEAVVSLLELGSGGVRMLGICGMGGIGKTTIASAVFDKISWYFHGSCFIENIREVSSSHNLTHLQEEVLLQTFMVDKLCVDSVDIGTILIRNQLCNRKVLIVLDDVSDTSQLEALAGDCNWFGEGSRIIITTRDVQLLVKHHVVETYYVHELNSDESVQFLKRHAFNEGSFTKEYKDLLFQIVRYASGLPLALKVLSSSLCGKSKKEWTSTLLKLQTVPEKRIYDNLKLSYDALDDNAKDTFLVTGCFLSGMKKDKAVRVLDRCGFSAVDGIQALEQKSLVRISNEHLHMHDLLHELAIHICKGRHPDESQRLIQLWSADDIMKVSKRKRGIEEISALAINDYHSEDDVDVSRAFKRMKNLRLLHISNLSVNSFQGTIHVPKELRWLTWPKYPLQSLPESFAAENLVGLEFSDSNLTKPWEGIVFLPKLQDLDLSYSRKLIWTPDFTGTPNLQRLVLDGCSNLVNVDESIRSLQNLFLLSLRRCSRLKALPSSIRHLKSLVNLDLVGCSELNFHHMLKVPSSIGFLHNLVAITLCGCENLEMLPPFDTLSQLHELSLSRSPSPPNLFKQIPNLRTPLYLSLDATEFPYRLKQEQPELHVFEFGDKKWEVTWWIQSSDSCHKGYHVILEVEEAS